MKQLKFTLSLAMFLLPFCAFAHGEEVLLPIYFQFASILGFFIVLFALKMKVREKMILAVVYLFTLGLILYESLGISYYTNRTAIDLSWSLGPAITTFIAFFILRPRYK